MKNTTINANGTEIRVYGDIANENAFICLTDIAKVKEAIEPRIVISNWMSSYATIDFLALWENIYIIPILTVWNSIRLEMKAVDW